MAEPKNCPKCGMTLPADAPAGICPQCLMQAGLASEQDAGSQPAVQSTLLQQRSSFVPPAPEDLGKLFPQLEILELLGMGGMGAVYKARQKSLDRLVAVKILPPEVGADPAFAERFSREARALGRLSHQNIVSVFDFGQAEGQFYFLMEYVDGANLRQLVSSGGIKPEEALAIVPQICEALQFAHGEGVVHRDIKPENILVDKQGRVKIADFGLAKLLGMPPANHSLTGTHQVMGTPQYMAPEQMQATRSVDHRADIYSLGVVFYEMLTGELPIGRFAPPSKKVRIDVRLDEVVLRALENEPAQRYQRASDIGSAVETISHSAASLAAQVATQASVAAAHGTPAQKPVASEDKVHDLMAIRAELEAPSLMLIAFGVLMVIGHLITVVVCLQNPWDAKTIWVGVPGLIVGCLMVCGGLSLRNLWSSGWAYLGAIAALIPAGPGWLITLFVGIWVFNVLARPHIRAAFVEKMRHAERFARLRFSRKAIAGACWAPFFVLALLCFFITLTPQSSPARMQDRVIVEARSTSNGGFQTPNTTMHAAYESPVQTRPAWWQWLLTFSVLPLGLTAPFATTILGLISISDIRHSGGRLIGMPLAVADALGYPLLVLDGLIMGLAVFLVLIGVFVAEAVGFSGITFVAVTLPAFLIAIPACILADVFIARAVWRRATRGLK